MLKDEIEEAKRTVSTDTVQITVGEVANMYGSSELNIIPDFSDFSDGHKIENPILSNLFWWEYLSLPHLHLKMKMEMEPGSL